MILFWVLFLEMGVGGVALWGIIVLVVAVVS